MNDPGRQEPPDTTYWRYYFWSIAQTVLAFVVMFWIALSVAFYMDAFGADLGGSITQKPETSTFTIRVGDAGKSTFTNFENVPEEVRETLRDTVFMSPDAATEAADGKLPGNPAQAHAVKVCTHDSGGVKSNDTGASYHWTWFRKHENNRHYTTTQHRYYQSQLIQTYKYSVSRSYCGCG